jgi:hypothetical protein
LTPQRCRPCCLPPWDASPAASMKECRTPCQNADSAAAAASSMLQNAVLTCLDGAPPPASTSRSH